MAGVGYFGRCVAEEQLSAFSIGLLSEFACAQIISHLESCMSCQQALAKCQERSDLVLVRLRRLDAEYPLQASFYPSDLSDRMFDRWATIEPATTDSVDRTLRVDTSLTETTGRHESSDSIIERGIPATIARYQVKGLIAQGAFGCVYLAHDAELDRDLAVKLPRETWESEENIARLMSEAQIVAGLRHAAIVAVHDAGRIGERSCFIAMEYVDGSPLDEFAARATPNFVEITSLLATVADALHYAHTKGLVHRDIKPANILIDAAGNPRVADFGLALHEDLQLERAGEFAGTPAYMAPEQLRREAHLLDGRADVWAIGVILYELLTGRRPFRGDRIQLVDQVLHRDPKPPRQICSTIPRELERIVLRCLERRPTERYPTALDLAADLRSWQRRDRVPWLTVAGVCVALAILGGTAFMFSGERAPATASRALLQQSGAMHMPPTFAPNQWPKNMSFELLRYEPTELWWPPGPHARHLFTPESQQFDVHTSGLAIWALAEVTDVAGYFYRVDLRQTEWTGRVGIVFGFQTTTNDRPHRSSCQVIQIVRNTGSESDLFPFQVVRSHATLIRGDVSQQSFHENRLATHLIPTIGPGAHLLEIEVQGSRLVSVRWDGMRLPNLTDREVNKAFGREEYFGCVGTYSFRSSATFERASFQVY